MKKLLFLLFLVPSLGHPSSIFNPGSGGTTTISSTTLPSGSTNYVQNSLTPTTTTQQFSVQTASAAILIATSSTTFSGFLTSNASAYVMRDFGRLIINQDGTRADSDLSGAPTLLRLQDRGSDKFSFFANGNWRFTGNWDWASLATVPGGIVYGNAHIEVLGGGGDFEIQTAGGTGTTVKMNNDAGGALAPVFRVLGAQNQTGIMMQMEGMSSTNTRRPQVEWDTTWIDSTDATRKARFIGRIRDTSARNFLNADADGTTSLTSVGGPVPLATTKFAVINDSNTYTTMVIKSTASPLANALEIHNNTGVVQSSITSAGIYWSGGKRVCLEDGTNCASSTSLLTSTNIWSGGNTFTSSTTFTSTAAFSGSVMLSSGSAGIVGVVTLIGGLATVNTTKVTAKSIIQLTHQNNAGILGNASINGITPGVSFNISSTNISDTSVVGWVIFEPNP